MYISVHEPSLRWQMYYLYLHLILNSRMIISIFNCDHRFGKNEKKRKKKSIGNVIWSCSNWIMMRFVRHKGFQWFDFHLSSWILFDMLPSHIRSFASVFCHSLKKSNGMIRNQRAFRCFYARPHRHHKIFLQYFFEVHSVNFFKFPTRAHQKNHSVFLHYVLFCVVLSQVFSTISALRAIIWTLYFLTWSQLCTI